MSAVSILGPFAIDALRQARERSRFGALIHYFETIDSTNTCAQQLAADGALEGTVVIGETQTKGRGRLGRTWISPPFRNLYLSVILRPSLPPEETARLALVVGLATAETVAEWVPGASLKWPNDVLIDRGKVAGILAEMGSGCGVQGAMPGTPIPELRIPYYVIAGIGVNLNIETDEFPPDVRDKATSLRSTIGKPIDRLAFTDRLLSRLEERYDLFLREGFVAIRPLWESLSSLRGRRVQIDDSGRRHDGTVLGIDDDGALRLRGDDGKEVRIIAGDVSVVDGYR